MKHGRPAGPTESGVLLFVWIDFLPLIWLFCFVLLFFAFNHHELHLCIFTFERKVFDGAHAYCYYFMLFCSLLSIIERASRVFRITCKPSYCPLEANESSIISAFKASYLKERLSRDQSPQGLH